jgi:adenylate cyclase
MAELVGRANPSRASSALQRERRSPTLRQTGRGTSEETGQVREGPWPGGGSPILITFPGLIRNISVLEKAAAGRGLLNIQPEADGIGRRVPLVLKAQGQLIPTWT